VIFTIDETPYTLRWGSLTIYSVSIITTASDSICYFSAAVATITAAFKRSSDIRLYDDAWSIFTSWDEEHGISPFIPIAPHLT
jgi:hypothetical protein